MTGDVADTFLLWVHAIGFEATAAYSAETAVRLGQSLMPDVLIIDALVGERNGVNLAAQITRELPDCEVVLFPTRPTADLVVDSNLHFKVLVKAVRAQDVLTHLAGLVRPAAVA